MCPKVHTLGEYGVSFSAVQFYMEDLLPPLTRALLSLLRVAELHLPSLLPGMPTVGPAPWRNSKPAQELHRPPMVALPGQV